MIMKLKVMVGALEKAAMNNVGKNFAVQEKS